MQTENDAKDKRCCGPESCGAGTNKGRFCIGSACMAWLWEFDGDPASHGGERGYCGLARK